MNNDESYAVKPYTFPPREDVHAFLTAAGFKPLPLTDWDRHDAHWQSGTGVEKEWGCETVRGYVNVLEWRMSRHQPGLPDSYEVEATFETPLGWVKFSYYALNGNQVMARLDAIKQQLTALQEQLMGEEVQEDE